MRLLPVRHAYGRWLPHACTWATGHITAATPLVRQSLGAIARYERQVIRKRMQGGRAAKAARGGYAYGGPPFGWRAEGKELVPAPGEQCTLALMRNLHKCGYSLREIADQLNAGEGYGPGRGRWHPQAVARALARPVAYDKKHDLEFTQPRARRARSASQEGQVSPGGPARRGPGAMNANITGRVSLA
jgi:hypothetical protein